MSPVTQLENSRAGIEPRNSLMCMRLSAVQDNLSIQICRVSDINLGTKKIILEKQTSKKTLKVPAFIELICLVGEDKVNK